MTRDELGRRLEQEGISANAFDLFGSNRDNAYCLERVDSGWLEFFRERGERDWEHLCESESQACEYLLQAILDDEGTRR
jgi:hypothetical protein